MSTIIFQTYLEFCCLNVAINYLTKPLVLDIDIVSFFSLVNHATVNILMYISLHTSLVISNFLKGNCWVEAGEGFPYV